MSVTTSNLAVNTINRIGDFDTKVKQALNKVVRASTGVRAAVQAVVNGSATTTAANTDLRVNGLKAGREYFVRGVVLMDNATGGNGARCLLSLTGTQTTAVVTGAVLTSTQLTTPTFIPATTTNSIVALATAYGATGTAAASNFVQVQFEGYIKPQNDGDFIVQVGSGSGSTQSRLRPGSFLEVVEQRY